LLEEAIAASANRHGWRGSVGRPPRTDFGSPRPAVRHPGRSQRTPGCGDTARESGVRLST
jgi:hypothetical protein